MFDIRFPYNRKCSGHVCWHKLQFIVHFKANARKNVERCLRVAHYGYPDTGMKYSTVLVVPTVLRYSTVLGEALKVELVLFST
jgi:hypothetical protein